MEQMGTKGGQVNTALRDSTHIAILPEKIASQYSDAGMLKDLSTLRLPAADRNLDTPEVKQGLAEAAKLAPTAERNLARWFAADAAHEMRTPMTAMRTYQEVRAEHPERGAQMLPSTGRHRLGRFGTGRGQLLPGFRAVGHGVGSTAWYSLGRE